LTKVFNKGSKKVTYVTKNDRLLNTGKYNIILSPEFYWIKRVKLPVKSLSKAKRLAPSVYEGSLPSGNYSYETRKVGDDFIIIAYDKEKILDKLSNIFPTKSDIKEVYFAQDTLSDINECVSINDKAALTKLDDILIQVPRKCTDTSSTINEYIDKASFNSKYRVKLKASSNQLLDRKDIIILSTLFALLFIAYLLEYISYKKDINKLEQQRAEIIKKNSLPPTMIQIRSIKKSLGKKFTTQKAFRDLLDSVSDLRLKKGEYIKTLDFSDGELKLDIHIADAKRLEEIKSIFKKSGMKVKSSSVEGDTLHLRMSI
jgi:hypothetical protein